MVHDFNLNPFIVIWELTRACQLHCLHCRAQAQRHRDPLELTTEEGYRLIDQIADMDRPMLVFTGGDPLERDDLFDFIAYGVKKGLRVSITPSATPKVTKEAMKKAMDAGLSRWAFSLDGSNASIHDRFRGTKGSFDLTMNALHFLAELGLPIQINSTVSRYNLGDLPALAEKVKTIGAVMWSVFFLVPTGRARLTDMISPREHEDVLTWLYELSQTAPFQIKTTAATHYRRIAHEIAKEAGREVNRRHDAIKRPPWVQGVAKDGLERAVRGVTDGVGFVFVSHTGEVYPSGFLPIVAGNIRERPLSEIYRKSPVMIALRDPEQYKGKCGVCEYRYICGGSRARAYAVSGDYLASDPACIYVPKGFDQKQRVL
jgi:radical SAM protein